MRVLMVAPSFYPIKGGSETVVRNLSIELNKGGIHVDVMTFNMDRKWKPQWKQKIDKIDGITVFKIPALDWFPFAHSPRLNLRVNLIPGRFSHLMREYDIIHYHEAEFSFPLFSFLVKKPKILHIHGIDADYFRRYHLSRFLLKNLADLYIALTEHMKNQLITLGVPQKKIRVLPNAVDIETFRFSENKIDNLILFVGRITYIKGLHILLESLRYLKTKIHLVIIGPPSWDISYLRKVLMQIENENRKGIHKVTYLGEQEPTNIIKWYQKASILVSPSFVEAFSVVNLEALACGTPIIATKIAGPSEIIKNGKNGILIPPNNPAKLAEAIQYLLDNKDIRVRLGREGRKSVVENFSCRVIAKKLLTIYKEMLT